LRAEPVEDAGELDGDVAAALDQDALRQLLEMERFVRGDDMLDSRNLGAVPGRRAGGNEDVAVAGFVSARGRQHHTRGVVWGSASGGGWGVGGGGGWGARPGA